MGKTRQRFNVAIALLLIATPGYAVEKLKAEGQVKVTIISQEQAEITPESGTVVLSADGVIESIIF